METKDNTSNSNEKYPVLRSYIVFYKIVAVIIGLASIGFYFYFGINSNFQILGWIAIILGGIIALIFVAFSEIIRVFLDIEQNTRNQSNR